MLSTHSFNALLKTLEEPPPHVKFLLATTDPQKLPVTVLSRCLQFNLKRFPPGMIFKRLAEIAQAESIDAEPEALRLVSRAAEGSMRDALSLLDQVIAFGGNKLTAVDTRTMLGTLDRAEVYSIIEAVSLRDARAVLARIAELDERAPDYREVLAELAAVLQKVALLQAVPDLQLDEAEDSETYRRLAASLTPEDTQLFYQIAIVGRRDLELAPDARAGFEMVLLRMLAFGVAGSGTATRAVQPTVAARQVGAPKVGSAAAASAVVAPAAPPKQPVAVEPAVRTAAVTDVGPQDWAAIVAELDLVGPAIQLAAHCELVSKQGDRIHLALDSSGEPFRRPALEEKLMQALSARFGELIKLEISIAAAPDTPARRQKVAAEDRLQRARETIDADPNVRALRDMFGATVQPDSVRPIE